MVGVTTEENSDGTLKATGRRSYADGILPAWFRAQIFRWLLSLLSTTEANRWIVEGLFELAGVTSSLVTRSIDDAEHCVSTECVSLLRHSHSPSQVAWRDCVNAVIRSIAKPSTGSNLKNGFCKRGLECSVLCQDT